jgi:hypothetical protein
MAETALERGLFIHSSCIWRWVQIYGPEQALPRSTETYQQKLPRR